MKVSHKNWKLCPTCKLITFADSLADHTCPDKVRAKIDADIDAVMDVEMSTWDKDLKKFWNSTDVKFMEWELENE